MPLWTSLLLRLLLAGGLAGCGQRPGSEAEALSDRFGCLRCHGMVRAYVGPGFAQVAERYRGDPDAARRLADSIRHGSVGTWGNVIMPRQPQITAAEAERLAAWVLAQPAAQ